LIQEINKVVCSLGATQENFCLLLTDAARYMTAARKMQKGDIPQVCKAHGSSSTELYYENDSNLHCC